MRGKDTVPARSITAKGITPAYAGKSRNTLLRQRRHEDHPRLCGEKHAFRWQFALLPGSPPPMRGKEQCSVIRLPLRRITPAYAGKSVRTLRNSHHEQDHPRLCGEKTGTRNSIAAFRGSPPPMRGKAYSRVSHSIPTWDHPRLCGEKFPSPSPPTYAEGSPPPMRGKAFSDLGVSDDFRITPAYAGKRLRSWFR